MARYWPVVRRVAFSLACLVGAWLLAETAFVVALRTGVRTRLDPFLDYAAWTNPRFVSADPLIGFRLQPGETNDGIRIIKGVVQYSYRGITGNGAGFHSSREYVPKRQRPYRIVVYGDSFTAMLYQNRAWPDHLHDLLEPAGIEVYNFSFEAAGLANWHEHYVHELIPKYEFDMVLFAVCCDDMSRAFSIWETRPDGGYLGRFASPPSDEQEFQGYRRELTRFIQLASPTMLRNVEAHFANPAQGLPLPFNLYLANALTTRLRVRFGASRPSFPRLSEAAQRRLFLALLRDIRSRGKRAAAVNLPWDGDDPLLRRLAHEGCATFLDGNDLVKPKTPDAFPHPAYDGHWLEPAADYFAERLAPALIAVRDTASDPGCSAENQ